MRNSIFTRLAVVLTIVVTVATASRAENVLGLENGDATTVGIFIKDLSTGRVLANHNAQLALTPASVTKVVTTATAMLTLGSDYHFGTDVYLSGNRSASARSRWEGDLVIRSVGDPTFGSSEFSSTSSVSDTIVAAIKRLGISEITGTVVILESMKDAGPCPTWECEDIAWPYGAGIYGFNYRGNFVRAVPGKNITQPVSELSMTLLPSPDKGTDQLRGMNANNLTVWAPDNLRLKEGWGLNTSNPNPAYTYRRVLADRLRSAGIKIGDDRVTDDEPKVAVKACTIMSPSSADIMRNLMKRSDNLFAEGMFRALVPDGRREDCIKAVQSLWRTKGLNTGATIMNDGSGLTRANRFSPLFLAQLLEYMATTPDAETFVDFFPVAGIDGTMKGFGAKTTLKGRLALKTGSVSSVQTYAGYRLDIDGNPTHVVVVMINGFFGPRAAVKSAVEKYFLKIFQ